MKREAGSVCKIAVLLFVTVFFMRGKLVEAAPVTKVGVNIQTQYKEAYDVLKIINRSRKSAGLKALTMDKSLLDSALKRAQECSIYYSHKRPNGKKWHTAIIKDYQYAGENIGFGFSMARTITDAWMSSPSHRKNIMNKNYTCVGIGCIRVGDVIFWAQEFTDGRPVRVSCPADKKKNVKIAVADKHLVTTQRSRKISMVKGEVGKAVLTLNNTGYDGLSVQVDSGMRYSTSDPSVATVTSRGRIKAVGTGTARIKVWLAGNRRVYRIYKISVTK